MEWECLSQYFLVGPILASRKRGGMSRGAWQTLPRLSLIGYLEEIPKQEVQEKDIEKCFVGKHRDARLWVPGEQERGAFGVFGLGWWCRRFIG